MKAQIGFAIYLAVVITYTVLTKDLKFLLTLGGLFIGVTAVTFFTLVFVNRCSSGRSRGRAGARG